MKRNTGKSGLNRWLIVILVVLVLVLAALLAMVWLGYSKEASPFPAAQTATAQPETTATPTPELQVDPNAGELITPTPAPTEPGVAIPGWGSITLPAGVTEAATALKNPDANADWYYLTFEMRLPAVDEETGEETYEVLFTTGLIPPGQYCNQVTLNRALEPGEYDVILHVQPYRMSDKSPTNNADMKTVLVVQ